MADNFRLNSGTLDVEYIKSLPGLLKVAEILCLLIAFASLSGFTLHFKDDLYGGRFDFFYFATITPWLLVIIIYVLFALRLHERLANINWDFVMTIFSPVVAFLLLVSSALVLDAAIYFRRNERDFNGTYYLICDKEPCGNVEAAGSFGVLSMVLFAVDSFLYFMKNRNTGSAKPPPGYDGENIDEVSETTEKPAY